MKLTNRELEVYRLAVMGHSNFEIADSMCIVVKGVKTHLTSIYVKLFGPAYNNKDRCKRSRMIANHYLLNIQNINDYLSQVSQ